ncbi:serine/threonine-protein kinase [Polyangium aurulentum]|uniref:serine/threonine-protein kinase n=1 Tax=Polyangium aurulentum TaxID=2567896 RepID=UPI00200F0768|nr:serine/threonine-protein kinase [Polyangium aurulentum]
MRGLLCPRCRYHLAEPPQAGDVLPRCPRDGLALVRPESLADADGDPFLGTTVGGLYVILAKIGAGSMGTVYRARHERMRRDVAVKILRADRAFDMHAAARFEREARATRLLHSPYTVTVLDFGEIEHPNDDELGMSGASLYLAMELLEGETLGDRLKREGSLPVAEAVRFARHALLSLAEAHDKGVIHRDLKPDNLFLCRAAGGGAETCKLLDFGIAEVLSEPGDGGELEARGGAVFGTPRYMSPEQAQGKPLDPRSDLYSVGVLLYQMLVGRPPFVDSDAVVVMSRHIRAAPVPPCDAAPSAAIPRALSDLVMRALAKRPSDRPESARAFIAALDDCVRERGSVVGARAWR